jgi:hypothetical protein
MELVLMVLWDASGIAGLALLAVSAGILVFDMVRGLWR